MRTLIFDTETTGLVDHKKLLEEQPHPVQMAAMLRVDKKIYAFCNLIITTDQESNPHAFAAHGISREDTYTYGISPATAVDLFLSMVAQADRIVAHNSDFDRIIMAGMIFRCGQKAVNFLQKKHICTMYSSMPVLKLPGRYGSYKWPKLDEAYRHLVDSEGFEGAHDAMQDVKATAAVLDALEEGGYPLVGGKH